jgi:DNA (cytosine-5)-methyltransferase 1
MKFNYIDLFAGCWWLSDWFEQSWCFSLVAWVEREKPICETFIKRLQDKRWYKNANDLVMCHDIQDTDTIIKSFDKKIWDKRIDLIVWWPPCQAYSIAGRIRDRDWMHSDYRNYLFESYIKMVNKYKPAFFIFENVPWILSATPQWVDIINEIKKWFDNVWYIISDDLKKYWLVDMTQYWVPQKRKRVIILWVRKDVFYEWIFEDFFYKFLADQKESPKTVEQSIWDLPKIFPIKNSSKQNIYQQDSKDKRQFLNHFPRYHNERDIEIFHDLAKDKKEWSKKYKTIEDIKQLYFLKTWKKSNIHKYYVLDSNSQSNTIVAHLYKDWLRHIHPDHKQSRSLTVREAARLQTFEDDFEFLWSMWDQYKMIGNAVPPRFSKKISIACKNLLHKLNKKWLIH